MTTREYFEAHYKFEAEKLKQAEEELVQKIRKQCEDAKLNLTNLVERRIEEIGNIAPVKPKQKKRKPRAAKVT